MSVNDITGLPILEVLDTDTVIAGSYNTNTFIVSGTRIAIGRTIDSTAKVAISGNTTVSGTLSTNNIIISLGGNSNQWNSNFSTTQSNSANWSQAYTNLTSNSAAYLSAVDISLLAAASARWNSNYTTTNANSGLWSGAYTSFNANSSFYDAAVNELFTYVISETGDEFITEDSLLMVDSNIDGYPAWNSTTDTMVSLSAGWQNAKNYVNTNSIRWESVYNNVNNLSGIWNSNYTTTNTNSAKWELAYNTIQSSSANWDNTYTNVSLTSASWDSTYNTTQANSAGWESTELTVATISGQWQSAYTTSNQNSARWSSVYTSLCGLSTGYWLLKAGDQVTGKLTTTQNLSTNFTVAEEFVSKRYVDAMVVASNISGNFIPSLYYTRIQTDDLINPLTTRFVKLSGDIMTGVLVTPAVSAGAYTVTSSFVTTDTGTSKIVSLSDNGKCITFSNTTPITASVPAGLPVGFNTLLIQINTGQVFVSAGPGVTINSVNSARKISSQHGTASLISYSPNIFNLAGSISI
jgi:hypothetical protein